MLPTAMRYSHTLLKEVLQPGQTAVDATMGNGFDTELLASLVGPTGQVFAFDIQEQALQATKKRLAEKELLAQVQLIHQGHETLADVVSGPVHAAIFNLGYLPKGDKAIIIFIRIHCHILAVVATFDPKHIVGRGRQSRGAPTRFQNRLCHHKTDRRKKLSFGKQLLSAVFLM